MSKEQLSFKFEEEKPPELVRQYEFVEKDDCPECGRSYESLPNPQNPCRCDSSPKKKAYLKSLRSKKSNETYRKF
jgi:hypothetical protein